jgi:hypothetical protein
LLAFERSVVVAAINTVLGSTDATYGDSYLEKILVNWLNEYLKTDDNFLFFLAKLIPDSEIHLAKNPIADLKQRRYASRVEDFMSIPEQADRIQVLRRRDDLTEKDRIRLDLLVLAGSKHQDS